MQTQPFILSLLPDRMQTRDSASALLLSPKNSNCTLFWETRNLEYSGWRYPKILCGNW